MSGEPFFMIWKSLARSKRISCTAKLLLAILADHTNSTTKQCNPKLATLAGELGKPVRTVQRALSELSHLGLVQITSGQRQSSYRVATRFEWSKVLSCQSGVTENPVAPKWRNALRQSGVTDVPISLLTELDQQNYTKDSLSKSLSRKNGSIAGLTISPTKKPSAEIVSLAVQRSVIEAQPVTALVLPKPQAETFERWFEERFWALYPRKTAKAAALTAARQAAGKSVKIREEILAGLYNQLPVLRSRDPQYVPHPATWIRQERWRDEPEVPRRPAESQRDRNWRIAAEAFLKESKG